MPPDEPRRRPSDLGRGSDKVGDRVRFEHILAAARDAVAFATGRARADYGLHAPAL